MVHFNSINGDNFGNYGVSSTGSTQGLRHNGTIGKEVIRFPKAMEMIKNGFDGIVKPKTPEEIQQAKAELSKKVSSTGMSYSDADKKIQEIRAKYNDDKYFTTVQVLVKGQKGPRPIMYVSMELGVADLGDLEKFDDGYDHYNDVTRFDPSKLPEPDRTDYMEAVASKQEIEHNNPKLASVASSALNHLEDADYVEPKQPSMPFDIVNGNIVEKSVTPKQKAARDKLNNLTTSDGISYKSAVDNLKKFEEKYKDSKYKKFVPDPNQNQNLDLNPGFARCYGHFELDVNKIPEPDKSEYLKYLNAVLDIEDRNSALVAQAGLEPHKNPLFDNDFLGQYIYYY